MSTQSIEPPDVPDLCRRLVEQLDDKTRGDLRLLVFLLAGSAEGTTAAGWLAAMYDHLEPKKAT